MEIIPNPSGKKEQRKESETKAGSRSERCTLYGPTTLGIGQKTKKFFNIATKGAIKGKLPQLSRCNEPRENIILLWFVPQTGVLHSTIAQRVDA